MPGSRSSLSGPQVLPRETQWSVVGNKYGNVVTTQSLVDEEALLCAGEAHADRTGGPWVGEHKAGGPPFAGGWGVLLRGAVSGGLQTKTKHRVVVPSV